MIEYYAGNKTCCQKIAYESENEQCCQEYSFFKMQIIYAAFVEIYMTEQECKEVRHEVLIVAYPRHIFNRGRHYEIDYGCNQGDCLILAKIPDK